MINKIIFRIKNERFQDAVRILFYRIYKRKAKSYKLCKNLVENKVGFEIGGPSKWFMPKNILPVYQYVKSLDNCNFSTDTIWDGKRDNGFTYQYLSEKPKGFQYVTDSKDLKVIPTQKYDFVLASHVLEHIANPIQALIEWIRVLKNTGVLILILPHMDGTFDRKRNVTTLTHLIEDYKNETEESDTTHLDEILKLHDLTKDPEAESFTHFKNRSLKNLENRCLHHHVFDTYLATKLIDYMKLQIISAEALFPYHIIIIAQKSKEYNNEEIINQLENNKFKSPFKSDKTSKA
jgi:ubiquinone/menaquinone biosynthesis C-methylase UbiE